MLVSIITRTHGDRGNFLEHAAACVFQQTYRPIEWIIVQDGNGTGQDTIDSLAPPDGVSLRFFQQDKLGRSAAANEGMKRAQGALINFFDDDDELFPDHISRLVGLMDLYPNAAGAYAAAYQTPKNKGVPDFENEEIFFNPSVGSYALIWQNLFPIQAVVFKKEIIQWNFFDRNLDALEDWLFWLSIFLERKLVWSPEITSRFFVPGPLEWEERIQSHIQAEEYFDLQRSALLKERGIDSIATLRDHYEALCVGLFAKIRLSGNPPQNTGRPDQSSSLMRALNFKVSHKMPARRSSAVIFTSINLAYLPKALVLANSVKRFNPDFEFHILLDDDLPDHLHARLNDVDKIVTSASLKVDNFHSWCFGMSVVEFCCATKPFYFKQLMQEGYEYVLYLDPDTKLFSDLSPVIEELQKHDVLITPHSDRPAIRDSEILLTERSILAHGVFNLGFLAARSTPAAFEVIEFWRARLVRYCYDDQRNGLFTDQKWFNLVPVYFDGVKVLKHEGCNVASWNISHRPISIKDGRAFAGNSPLIFFHFSGYDARVPKQMFQIFGQYNDALAQILHDYNCEVDEKTETFQEAKFPWAFKYFDNGVVISDAIRIYYRSFLDHRVMYPEPFFSGASNSFFRRVEQVSVEHIEDQFSPKKYG